ncbi:MAG TPA: glycosyltransferase, partial [Ktedonobacterales bacterium]
HVITVGWPFEQLLLKRGVKPEKMTIILNSADPDIFPPERRIAAPFDRGAENFTVAYWGTAAHRNGLDFAIRALALARQTVPHLRLAIQGRGETIPELKELAEALGVAEAITWTDPGPVDKIVDVILNCDAGIIPYRLDGFAELVLPTKAYELAWMQRPIIAARTAGIVSMFRPESMMLCAPEDPIGFAEAIIALHNDQALRQRLVANAAADYAPYHWEAMSQRYLELLRRLLGRTAAETATAADVLAPPAMVMPPR